MWIHDTRHTYYTQMAHCAWGAGSVRPGCGGMVRRPAGSWSCCRSAKTRSGAPCANRPMWHVPFGCYRYYTQMAHYARGEGSTRPECQPPVRRPAGNGGCPRAVQAAQGQPHAPIGQHGVCHLDDIPITLKWHTVRGGAGSTRPGSGPLVRRPAKNRWQAAGAPVPFG